MFKRFCLFTLNKCWQFLAFMLILFAIFITIARYMMPTINDYRKPLEELITEISGTQVTIGHIQGSWETLGPVIEIENIRFGKPLADLSNSSSIQSLKISIAIFPTLFYRTIITDQLIIEGLKLRIAQQQAADFKLPDIVTKAEDAIDITPIVASTIQDWLQNQSKIMLINTLLDINLRDGQQYPITLDEIHFEKGKGIYQLTGLSKLPGDNQIDFILEVDGFLTDPKSIGKLYIDTHKINMSELPLNAVWKETEILSGTLDLKLWADWKNSHFESTLIALEIDQFQMSLRNKPQTKLNKYKSHLIWQRQLDGWVIESSQTEIISQDRIWPDPSFSIKMQRNNQQKHYRISASRSDLGIWADLILTNPNLDSEIREQLLTMDPNGFLDDGRIFASFKNNTLVDFRANAYFSELSWQPWKKLPGINNITGQFEIHENDGVLIVDSRNAVIDYPDMFRWPFEVKSINSQLSWKISDQLLSIKLSNLTADLTDVHLLADGVLNIARGSNTAEINLYAELEKGDVSQTKQFLPTGIMSNDLVDYLDQSIKSGQLHTTQIAIRGPVTQFPFSNLEGIFAINAQVADAAFVFDENWPKLEHIKADLWFVGNSMAINVFGGESFQQNISNASITIDDFSMNPQILQVASSSKGNIEDGIDYINHSPLKNSVGKIFDIIPTSGDFDLDLQINIPLTDEQLIKLDGNIHLQGNSMMVKPVNMAINNIQGNIRITDSLIKTDDLTAEIIGGKSQLKIAQQLDDNGLLTTTILSKGDINSAALRKVFPKWIPNQISGNTGYHSTLVLPEIEKETTPIMDLTVNSDLKGITIQYPPPFDKSSDKSEVFTLNFKLLENNQQLFSASLSELFDAKLHFSNKTSSMGQIVFGGEKALISGQRAIELTGHFEQINLQPWFKLLLDQANSKPENNRFKTSDYDHLYIDKLSIAALNYYFMNFDQVTVSSEQQDNSLLFNILGNGIAGNINVPDHNLSLPIAINLSTLNIPDQFSSTDTEVSGLVNAKAELDAAKSLNFQPLPALKIQCEECIYNDYAFGKTTINITPLENGNAFSIDMDGVDILNLNLQGNWIADDDSQLVTTLSGDVKTNKLEQLLKVINLQTGIHDTKLKAHAKISWKGNPLQFNYPTLVGTISLKGGKGSQEDLSDRDARIFSLFSVGSLARKLTLDFSDLFGDGFFYNGMTGDFAISDGVFSTSNLKIDGISADVEVIGLSDFPNNSIENCVLVTPDLSSSLPVLAGWAIEPVTGLVVYLMSKLFQPALKVVTSLLYKIEGPFENPVITQIAKAEGTATVDHSGGKETTIITTDSVQTQFNCDNVFKN